MATEDISHGIAALQRRWADQEAELEDLRVVVAALILREGKHSIELTSEDIDAVAMWQQRQPIEIRMHRIEPGPSIRLDLV